ncbi:MAG: PIN domain-containing protein [Anaerolineales bacterium]|nr:PIN domain-containing protein [Anaerolineales bacterium]
MSFVVVDASVWVARLVPQNAFHTSVRAWMNSQRMAGSELLSPSLLLAEVSGAITRRTGDAKLAHLAIEHLEGLPGLRLVEMGHVLLRAAANLAAELGLRGADSIYVAIASRLDLPLATLDVDQRQRAAARVTLVDIPIA